MSNNVLETLDSDELLALACIDFDADRLDAALVKLKLAEKKNVPAEAYALSGRLYAKLELFERARKSFRKYLEMHPESLVTLFQYGMVHLDSGDFEGALEIFEQVLEKDSSHPPTLFHKALALSNKGEQSAALKVLDDLLVSAAKDNFFYERALELRAKINAAQNSVMSNDSVVSTAIN